jgi:hypothetical protein
VAACAKSEGLPSVTILADKPPGFVDKAKKLEHDGRSSCQHRREVTETCWAKPGDSAPFRTILRGTKGKQEKTLALLLRQGFTSAPRVGSLRGFSRSSHWRFFRTTEVSVALFLKKIPRSPRAARISVGANTLFLHISPINAPTRLRRHPSALFSAKNRDTPAHHLDRHKQKIGRSPAYTFLCENEDTPPQELRR